MSWSLELLQGDAALDRLRDLDRDGSWQRLAAADPKPTCFQEAPFVLAWYDAYAGVCEPVVAVGEQGGELVGLLCLATRGDGEIVIAGANHAWYEGWIAAPEIDSDFITAAVDAVIETQRPATWRWKYLVRGANADWVEALSSARGIVSEHRAPVWDLTRPDAIDRLLKPRLRNYINRFRKRGELVLEPLEAEAAIRAIHVVAPWSDLRHGAVRADLPFRDDPRKMGLHERLAVAGPAIQTSVLRCDERPLAVHQGLWDGERLFAGLYAFDPTAARQSPGNILMLELAQHVLQLGGREIDLTPGGEWWKDEFASHHETVYRVELFADAGRGRARRLGRSVVGGARALLGRLGIEPDDVRRLTGALKPSAPPAEAAVEVFEIRVDDTAEPRPEDTEPLHGVDAPWLDRILSIDDVRDRAAAARFLSLSSRLLSRGWRPLSDPGERPPGTIVWAQPPGIAAVIPEEPGIEPIALVRNPGNAPAGTAVPDPVEVVLIGRDRGNVDALIELLARARAQGGGQRLWVVGTELTDTTRSWLLANGSAIELTRAAA